MCRWRSESVVECGDAARLAFCINCNRSEATGARGGPGLGLQPDQGRLPSVSPRPSKPHGVTEMRHRLGDQISYVGMAHWSGLALKFSSLFARRWPEPTGGSPGKQPHALGQPHWGQVAQLPVRLAPCLAPALPLDTVIHMQPRAPWQEPLRLPWTEIARHRGPHHGALHQPVQLHQLGFWGECVHTPQCDLKCTQPRHGQRGRVGGSAGPGPC